MTEPTDSAGATPAGPPTGKGRATPKRQPSRGPVQPPPATRKEAAKRLKEQNASKRQRVRGGQASGEERYLLPRDAGPVRKLVRDLVDSRRTTATLLLPAAVLPLLGSLTGSDAIAAFTTTLWVFAIALAMFDFVTGGLRIRRTVKERHPDEKRTRGHVFYGIIRMLQFRRLRVPKPTVAVGTTV